MGDRFKTFIINLERSSIRRRNIVAEARRHGLDYELISAVDGTLITELEMERLPIADVVRENRGYYTPSMIGAALSHAKVYERIVESETDVALVLEDDAVLCDEFAEIACRIVSNMHESELVICHFMRLSPLELSDIDSQPVGRGYKLYYPRTLKDVTSGAAYFVTRAAAGTLLETVFPIRAEADEWETFHALGAFDSLRFVHPQPVSVRGDKSTIASDRQSTLRRWLTAAVHDYRLPPLYQMLRAARLRSVRTRSRVEIVKAESELFKQPGA